jgi:hypothetical protein
VPSAGPVVANYNASPIPATLPGPVVNAYANVPQR